ncbi:MAG: hypothetical protein WC503_06935 [Candidatus Shapirobacteria bacterium]
MKLWYVLVLVLGVGIGFWLLNNFGVKTSKKMTVVEENNIKNETKELPEGTIIDNKGVKVETKDFVGIVRNWSPETGIIEIDNDNKIWKFTINPSETIIFVPNLKDKSRAILITDTENIHWNSAFCLGDYPVTFQIDDDRVVSVNNGGFRPCGFKGE